MTNLNICGICNSLKYILELSKRKVTMTGIIFLKRFMIKRSNSPRHFLDCYDKIKRRNTKDVTQLLSESLKFDMMRSLKSLKFEHSEIHLYNKRC